MTYKVEEERTRLKALPFSSFRGTALDSLRAAGSSVRATRLPPKGVPAHSLLNRPSHSLTLSLPRAMS